MHPCLSVPEIKRMIFTQFDQMDDDDWFTFRKTLAAAALTCHELSDVALDYLWEYQLTLGPLIKVMPPDLWMATSANGTNHRVTFTRPLRQTDFLRFDFYASKVKYLDFSQDDRPETDTEIDESVLQAFAVYRPSRVFLPNLKSLEFDATLPPRHLGYFPVLLSDSIKAVVMDLENECDSGALISTMSRLCPKIERLTISKISLPSSLVVNDLIIHLFHLKSLGLHRNPSLASVRHLGQLPSLSTWTLEGSMDNISGPVPETFREMGFTTENGRFPALNTLDISSTDYDYPHFIIKGMQCPFDTLNLDIDSNQLSLPAVEKVSACARLCETISHHACRTTLTGLTLNDFFYKQSHVEGIECLFQLKALERVRLAITNVSTIDDVWLLRASAAWPSLQTLSIEWMTSTTLLGLAPLIRGCPDLIKLSVCARWDPFDLHLLGDDSPRNLAIDSISTWAAPINRNVVQVFRCLVTMFPRLKYLENLAENAPNGTSFRNWELLNGFIRDVAPSAE